MNKYSVEVSRYIVTYYKDTTVDPDTGEEKVVRGKSFTKLANLSNTVGFDNFIEETRWINSEIVDILDKVWKALPGKHVYLSKSVPNTTLDIKLSIHGFPKTIYRIVYKHHRNELGDYLKDYADKIGAYDNEKPENVDDKKLKTSPSPVPISDEERALLDELTNIGKEFRKEIDHLKNDGLLSIIESRRIVSYFASIASSIRYILRHDDYEYGWDKITKAYWQIKENMKEIESINIYVSSNYISHSNTMIGIVNRMHTLIWDVDNLKHPGKDWPEFASIAIPAVDYCRDYVFHVIDQHLSANVLALGC